MKSIIIGAGASGMMAALTASEKSDNEVILLEKNNRIGKKLLSTGNGRCNLSNVNAKAKNYHGKDSSFVIRALEEFSVADTLDFFKNLGLLCVTEDNGKVYPLSNSANSVLDVLRFALTASNIDLRTDTKVQSVKKTKSGFNVILENETLSCDKLIIACGGAASEKLGGTSDGYKILESLGHRRTSIFPSLVQVTTEPDFPRALKGVKVQSTFTLMSGEKCIAANSGEVLFTEKGVSGPAIFEISREVSTRPNENLKLCFDFLPKYQNEEIHELILNRIATSPTLHCSDLLVGTVQNRLAKMLIKYAGIPFDMEIQDLNFPKICDIIGGISDFTLNVRGTEGLQNAQVTAGGVLTSEFSASTMESRIHKNLYACGEVLDIDGDCGGYNLQWAWSSGRLAGRLL